MDIPYTLSLLGSRIKLLEVLALIDGVKPAGRILCPEGKLRDTLAFLDGQGMAVEESPFKVLKDHSQGAYADRSFRAGRYDSRNGHVCLYVSKDSGRATEARDSEDRRDHRGFGLALGYPECCCAFFEEHFSASNTDLTLDTLEHSEGHVFPCYSTVAARHFDASLLSHFPCSFRCAESVALAQKHLNVLEKHAPEIAAAFMPLLRTGVVYARGDGPILLKGHRQEGSLISFDEVVAGRATKLYYLLSREKQLRVEGKNRIVVGGEVIEGKDRGVMVFQ
ncbi:TPA: hypothetical protein HA295_01095 [Candidatus Woesearchaeota archaeon]|nr:hypothetical protein [Candidatus Woesearchaeota archaeon]